VARKWPYGEIGKWGHPPPPFLIDKHRWQAFCRTVADRICSMRMADGIDGRREGWQTFATPLPAEVLPFRPYRPRSSAIPTLPRDARGRLMARREEAS
jgi:hypothetical protein